MDASAARFISRLTTNTMALVLAGGRGERLGVLTDWRTKPAVPFGGKFRIIDFTLSNCLHSGINKACVLTQYKSHSLIKHLMRGWTKVNTERGEFLDIIPAQQWTGEETWFQGTADAVYQSLDIIEGYEPEYLVILAGDHIYNMDYGEMLAEHVNVGADFTVACMTVNAEHAKNQYGVMEVNEGWRITGFEEKPTEPQTIPGTDDVSMISMGIYVVSQRYLSDRLREDAEKLCSTHDFGTDIIPDGIARGDHFHAHQFRNPRRGYSPYWRDVGTVDAYFQANMELLSGEPPIDLYDPSWSTVTHQPQMPPALFRNKESPSNVIDTMVSGGCIIKGSNLQRSILYSNVVVDNGCNFDQVLALPGCKIGSGSKLSKVILDNHCEIPPNTIIGGCPEADTKQYLVTEGGVVVVNRRMLGQGDGYQPNIRVASKKGSLIKKN